MTDENLSLRETKRRATFDAIEDAATALVLERGFDCVTVDEICEVAGIARRTFFNYVDSKETAVYGLPLEPPSEDAGTAFIEAEHAEPLVDLLYFYFDCSVLVAAPEGRAPSLQVIKRRKILNRQAPGSVIQRYYRDPELYSAYAGIMTAFLERHPGARSAPDMPVEQEALYAVALCGTALRVGMHAWIRQPDSVLEDLKPTCREALRNLLRLSLRPGPDAAPDPATQNNQSTSPETRKEATGEHH